MRLGVTIRFEKENIDTGKFSSEQTATIYAAFAQMESTGHSSNMRFSVRMRMEKGIFTPSSMPYGYRLNGLEPEIIPEEAEVVRHIFGLALQGQGHTDITKWLNESGVERGHGRERWHCSMVGYILSNRFYTGDSVWQKTCATDTLPIQQVKNRGQKPQYHVEDDHPGIISREDFQRVQELIAARKELFYRGSKPYDSIYTGHIFCGHCGCVCRRKVTLHGQELLQPLLDQLREIRELKLRSNQRLSDIGKEIANISGQNLVLTRLKSKGCIDSALALSQADELGRRLRDLRRLRRKVLEAADGDEQIQTTEAMLDYLDGTQWQAEVTPGLFENMVERITVVSADEVRFRLLNGLELAERLA